MGLILREPHGHPLISATSHGRQAVGGVDATGNLRSPILRRWPGNAQLPKTADVYTAYSGQLPVMRSIVGNRSEPPSVPLSGACRLFQGFQGRKTTRPRQAPFSSALSYNESSPQRTFPRLAAAGKADGLIMLAPKGSPAGPQA